VNKPRIELLLRGYSMGCDQSNFALAGVYLVEAPQPGGGTTRILYDCAHLGRRKLLLKALAARGLEPADVDVRVLSHAHWDHVQNADLFAASRVCLHAADLEYAARPRGDDHATPPWTAAIMELAGAEPVPDGAELAPGVTVVHLPGHTAGSVGLTVAGEDGLAMLTGDAMPSRGVLAAGQNTGVYFSIAAADESVRRVRETADLVYPGHDRPFRIESHHGPLEVSYLTETVPITFEALDVATVQADLRFEERDYGKRSVLPGVS
jgi:N-acyl homoserine lactone hydrolase